MNTGQMTPEKAKDQVISLFLMLGDYSLPERSHLNDLPESSRHQSGSSTKNEHHHRRF
ncbi:MAG: hypothetical protein K6L80_14280 [Agarilytica sp.]